MPSSQSNLVLGKRLSVLGIAAARLTGRAGICDPLPKGMPIAPAVREPVRPAVFVPEQIERVTKCAFNSTVPAEIDKLTATEALSAPPVALEFLNAAVFGGQIFCNGQRFLVSRLPPYRAALGPVRQFDELTLAQSHTGSTVFGHWLMDDCATREIQQVQGQSVAITRPGWVDCAAYERLFQHNWEEVPAFTARRLTLLTELGFSRDKAARHRRLRQRIRQTLPPGPGDIVYLARGPSGHVRGMANEPEVLSRMEAAGVTIVQCEGGDDSMLRRCLDARLIIGVEGSQLCHGIYLLAEAGGVLAIQPPDRFCNAHHDWSRHLGMAYGTVIGHPAEGGWTADPDEIVSMIDTLSGIIA